jgi:hypothetical protein
MPALFRMFVGLLFVGTLAAGCTALQPAFLADLGLDFWSLPELWGRLHDEEVRLAELTRTQQCVCSRHAVKDEATQDLIAGRLTLAEAVERFEQASGESLPLARRQLRLLHPDAPEGELLHQHVIDYVLAALENEPQRSFAVVARLQQEARAARPARSAGL